ncbi:MAG: hypothetical protein O3A02_02420, partial [bacterium]|nr:hypothetical protein [bacterium]
MPRTFGHLIDGREIGPNDGAVRDGAVRDGASSFESRSSSRLVDVLGVFPEATRDQVREACV